MIRVWHNRHFLDYACKNYTVESAQRILDEDITCDLAASIDTDDPTIAYQFTNNIDKLWGENQGVKATGLSQRSTSVGDIFEFKDGIYLIVETFGYRALSREETARITWHSIGTFIPPSKQETLS